jgi:putative peptidoglycan lipid II flippase
LTSKGHILRSTSVIAFVTIISRIFGYLRDQRIALLLGTTPAADAFVLAFRLPNLVRRMTGEGALGASLIPVFSGYIRNRSAADTWAFARKLFWDLALFLAIVAVLGVVFSRQVILAFTILSGNHAQWGLAVYLNRIIFPAVIFIGLAGVTAALLNSFHIFGLPAATPIFFNLTMIMFSFGLIYRPLISWKLMDWVPPAYRTPAIALAAAVVIGSAIQLAIQIPALIHRGMDFAPAVSLTDPGVRTVGKLMGPAFFGTGVYQINMVIDMIFGASSRMPSGTVTSLYVADRVMQLVLGSYAIAMSTALLPTMSQQIAAGKWGEMKRTFGFSLRIVSFITIPAAVGLVLLRRPIVQVLFQHGQFLAASTALTARALFCYSLGLPAFAAIKLITPMYYSVQDTWTPARVGLWALLMNVALNSLFLLLFFRTLSNGSPALASSLAAYFNFGMLFVLFRKRHGRLGARGLIGSFAKMAACAAAMGAIAYGALALSRFSEARHLFAQAGLLAAMITVSVGVYFGLAWILRCEELPEVFLLLRRRETQLVPVEGEI